MSETDYTTRCLRDLLQRAERAIDDTNYFLLNEANIDDDTIPTAAFESGRLSALNEVKTHLANILACVYKPVADESNDIPY